MKMPSEKLKTWWRDLPKTAKTAFSTAMIAGILTHLFILTNKVFNYNEISVLFLDKQEMLMGRMAEGRWLVGILGQWIGGNYSMQAVAGLLGIFLLALSAAMVTVLLRVDKPLYAGLIGIVMVVFPAIVSFMAFTQLGDAWFMAVFFAVLAVFLAERYRYGILGAIVLVGFSLAIHQAYISVTVAVMYGILFFELFREKHTWKEEWKTVVRYLVILLGGFILYYVGVKVSTALLQYDLSDYYGINEMTKFTPKGICKGIVYAYLYFLRYFFTTHYYGSAIMVGVNVILAVCLLGYAGHSIWKRPEKDPLVNRMWKVVLLGLLPIGCNCLPVLMADRVGAGVDRYMMYSLVFVWIILLTAACDVENLTERKQTGREFQKIFCMVVLIGVVIQIGHDYTMDNQAYYREQAATEQMASYLNRVAARIEAMEGWDASMPVYIVMDEDLYPNYPVRLPAFDALKELRGTAYEPNFNEQGLRRYMAYYMHFPLAEPTDEQIERVKDQLADMPSYPAADSIQIVDGVLIVKIG